MKLRVLIFAFGLLLLGCGERNDFKSENDSLTSTAPLDTTKFVKNSIDTNNNASKVSGDTAQDLFSIDTFKKFPDEIDGCSCYFSPTQESFQQRQYFYVANFDSAAFVSIDKKLITLKLTSTTREPNSFGDYDRVDMYTSKDYKVVVDIKFKKQSGDETWFNTGTITIEDKKGRKISRTFYGECGC